MANVQAFDGLPVTESMKTKLKQLTVVSLAAKSKRLPYELLLHELGMFFWFIVSPQLAK